MPRGYNGGVHGQEKPPLEILWWGNRDFEASHRGQLERLENRVTDQCSDALIMVEHPHVFTVGRRKDALANLLATGDVPVVEIERGGDVTYHGPGQLVVYPIIKLGENERDLHAFLRNLEQGMIDYLTTLGLAAERQPGNTGVWLGENKIASIGVACRRWVTFHGLAINLNTDLRYFERIRPCGFEASVMTSVQKLLNKPIVVNQAAQELATHLARCLNRQLV